MKKRKLTVWILAATLCAGLALGGCGRKESEDTEIVAEIIELELEDEAEDFATIGDTLAPIKILMTNKMGSSIRELSVKLPGQEEFPDNMMATGQTFENDETVEFYYDPEAEAAAAGVELPGTDEEEIGEEAEDYYGDEDYYEDGLEETELAEEEEAEEAEDTFSLQLTMDNGKVYVITHFDLEDMEEVSLFLSGDVAYLEYISLETDLKVNTLDIERNAQSAETAVQAVIDMIEALPEVKEENINSAEMGIKTARAAYEALTEEQKLQVTNLWLLEEREYELAVLNGTAETETEVEETTTTTTTTTTTYDDYGGSSSSSTSYNDNTDYSTPAGDVGEDQGTTDETLGSDDLTGENNNGDEEPDDEWNDEDPGSDIPTVDDGDDGSAEPAYPEDGE